MTKLAPIALALVACGTVHDPGELQFTAPVALGLATDDCVPNAFSGLSAELRIGGYDEPCPLGVNQQNLTVSGTCPAITPYAVRPLVLVWTLPAPNGTGNAPARLAYHVSFVDLRRETLENLPRDSSDPTVGVASIDLVDDGVSGVILFDPDDIAAIPTAEAADTDLDRALVYAKIGIDLDSSDPQQILNRDGSLGDVCPNIMEACVGTLFVDDVEGNASQCLSPP